MTTQLKGPYSLQVDTIRQAVSPRRLGVFALGHIDHANTFRIERVGRSDEELREELMKFVGSSSHFKFKLTMTAMQTFRLECELFHRFRPQGNFIHPTRPPNTTWACPVCRDRSLG
ncbi:MAG: hypothetical protein AAF732_07130 [Pseudomonadota bacterium]